MTVTENDHTDFEKNVAKLLPATLPEVAKKCEARSNDGQAFYRDHPKGSFSRTAYDALESDANRLAFRNDWKVKKHTKKQRGKESKK